MFPPANMVLSCLPSKTRLGIEEDIFCPQLHFSPIICSFSAKDTIYKSLNINDGAKEHAKGAVSEAQAD